MERLASEIREQAWRADELINAHRGVIERLKELTNTNLKTMNAEEAVISALRQIADDIEQFTQKHKCVSIINGPFFSENLQLCGRPAQFKVDDIPGWSGLDLSQTFLCEEHLKLSLQSFPETIYHPIQEKKGVKRL